MRNYELMIIAKIGNYYQEIIDDIKNVIEEYKGNLQGLDHWGEKRLAWKVKEQDYGDYALITLSSNPNGIKELDRKLRINENVLRYMFIRKD